MRIVTLVENCVYGHKLQAEHGLSMYIETPNAKILFDTGASDLFIRNARFLHIDLREVDILVLSHGHYDHAGGLHAFLEHNIKAKIYCKKEALDPKIKNGHENGILHTDRLDLTRFRFVSQKTEITPGIFVLPDIPIVDPEDTHFTNFEVIRNGKLQPDTFEDELALIVQDSKGLNVFSACSHRGITNILKAVKTSFPSIPIQLIIGGYHIHKAPQEKCTRIAEYFKQMPQTHIGVCHCTGIESFAKLYATLGSCVFYNHTGLEINTESHSI